MGLPLPPNPLPLLSVSLFSVTIFLGCFPFAARGADYTTLVFKGCADQKFQDPSGVYLQNLKNLMSTLVSQSSQQTFSNTTSGQDPNAIRGLYQCRGDLTTSQCYSCVSKIPEMSDKFCGKSVAARIQLSGCYLRYEIAGFKQVPDTQFLYKVCRSSQESGTEFEGRRDTAFNMTEDGVKSGNRLFYTGDYQSVYVLGQCEGDLAASDCGDCVKNAFETAKDDCGNSISGQVYLQKCYISYSYYPNGVPTVSSSSGKTKKLERKERKGNFSVLFPLFSKVECSWAFTLIWLDHGVGQSRLLSCYNFKRGFISGRTLLRSRAQLGISIKEGQLL